jgi:hypothetical protein
MFYSYSIEAYSQKEYNATRNMSIEAKHAYRFRYLKSEKWCNVRIAALAREKGCCEICGIESISNDAHHVWYPENIYETTEKHLVILCRSCHTFVHAMLPDCKTNDEQEGLRQWNKFRNAILNWRREKILIFQTGIESDPKPKAKDLRLAYESLKGKYQAVIQQLHHLGISDDGILTPEQEYDVLKSILSKWWKERKNLTVTDSESN